MRLALVSEAGREAMADALGPDGVVRVVSPGDGPAALAEAARTLQEVLVLDVAVGPGLGLALVRYRIARPVTRVVVLAAGREPGDPDVGALVAAGVYDVCADAAGLAAVLARAPATIADAVAWLPRGLSPEAAESKVVTRTVERRVAVGSHPVTVLVAGVAGGVGTTTVACAIAGYTARLGHDTALVGIGPYGVLGMEGQGGTWRPHLDTFPCAEGVGDLVRSRRYPYIVVDAGVAPMGETGGGDGRTGGGASALPTVGADPDVSVLVL